MESRASVEPCFLLVGQSASASLRSQKLRFTALPARCQGRCRKGVVGLDQYRKRDIWRLKRPRDWTAAGINPDVRSGTRDPRRQPPTAILRRRQRQELRTAAAPRASYATDPIDAARPFELELFCVPAEEECSDALLPFGCGVYGSVDASTIDAFRHVCDTPARRLITQSSDTVSDLEARGRGLELSRTFGFIRAHEKESFPIGTLAVANELRLDGFDSFVGKRTGSGQKAESGAVVGSDRKGQNQPKAAMFTYYGLARFHLLDILPSILPGDYPVGLVQLFFDNELELPVAELNELESVVVEEIRTFLRLSSSLATASNDFATAALYEDRLDELEALLIECSRSPNRVDSRWGKRYELISFFVCDHLELSPEERAHLLQTRDSAERLSFALSEMKPLVAELAALLSVAKAFPPGSD